MRGSREIFGDLVDGDDSKQAPICDDFQKRAGFKANNDSELRALTNADFNLSNVFNMTAEFKDWSMGQLLEELLTGLRQAGVPYSSQARRAVLTNQNLNGIGRPRSLLLGLYTKMGLGIATQTGKKKWQRILTLIHLIADHRPPNQRSPYAAVMVNCNTRVPVHADKANTGESSLISMGLHRDGHLWVEDPFGAVEAMCDGKALLGRALNTHGQWQSFDGRLRHCVLPALPPFDAKAEQAAERYSITLFCPGRLDAVPGKIWDELQGFGFPIQMLCEELQKVSTVEIGTPQSSEVGKKGRSERRTPYEAPACAAAMAAGMPLGATGESVGGGLQTGSSTACMLSLDTCWQRLMRGRMPSRFLEFLRQGQNYQSATVGEEMPSLDGGSHADSLDPLPCAVPYHWENLVPPRSG
eukprot:6454969-Amphidinium_carterae.2